MNPAVIWNAFAGIARAANAVLSFIPALVWAVALACAAGYGTVMHHERNTAHEQRDAAVGEKRQIVAQLEQQQRDAKAKLDKLTHERDAAQAQLDAANTELEKQLEKRRIDNRAATAALAAAADRNGGRLRDPNASGGCGRGGAEGEAPAAAGDHQGHGAEAAGLLSTQLSGLLQRLTREADEVSDAYAACRADDLSIRRALGDPPPP
jgi:TolA-binding protein